MTYNYPGNYVTCDARNLESEWYQRAAAKNGVISISDHQGKKTAGIQPGD